MNAPLGQLFILIQQRLAGVEGFEWVDQNFGQLQYDTAEYRPPVKFPCVLIDLTGISYRDSSETKQTVEGKLVVTIATAPVTNSNALTPTLKKELALQYYDLEWKCAIALHNWRPTGFGRILRRTADKIEREDTLRERQMVFDFSFTEVLENDGYQKVARPDPLVGSGELPLVPQHPGVTLP